MPSTIGTTLKVTLFGQSHGSCIGAVIEGLPSGKKIDEEKLAAAMARRAPQAQAWSTARKEADAVRIVSGLNNEHRTCGAPLALLIENTNTRSSDYDTLKVVPRPGHADWVAQEKWGGHQDVAGGGHFSARLTAPLVAAGAIAAQLLETNGVAIAAHVLEIAGVLDDAFDALGYGSSGDNPALCSQIQMLSDGRDFPVLNKVQGASMQKAIADARADGDSVGGVIECVATGIPAGIGSPIFDGIESTIARAVFGIPAVKGLEFGSGFSSARMRGSQNNDPYEIVEGLVRPAKNAAGGNLGGITTGAPLHFKAALKPTPSIAKPQASVNLITGSPETLEIKGRHDPCVVVRAVPVIEAVAALAILDSWLSWPAEAHPERRFN